MLYKEQITDNNSIPFTVSDIVVKYVSLSVQNNPFRLFDVQQLFPV